VKEQAGRIHFFRRGRNSQTAQQAQDPILVLNAEFRRIAFFRETLQPFVFEGLDHTEL